MLQKRAISDSLWLFFWSVTRSATARVAYADDIAFLVSGKFPNTFIEILKSAPERVGKPKHSSWCCSLKRERRAISGGRSLQWYILFLSSDNKYLWFQAGLKRNTEQKMELSTCLMFLIFGKWLGGRCTNKKIFWIYVTSFPLPTTLVM